MPPTFFRCSGDLGSPAPVAANRESLSNSCTGSGKRSRRLLLRGLLARDSRDKSGLESAVGPSNKPRSSLVDPREAVMLPNPLPPPTRADNPAAEYADMPFADMPGKGMLYRLNLLIPVPVLALDDGSDASHLLCRLMDVNWSLAGDAGRTTGGHTAGGADTVPLVLAPPLPAVALEVLELATLGAKVLSLLWVIRNVGGAGWSLSLLALLSWDTRWSAGGGLGVKIGLDGSSLLADGIQDGRLMVPPSTVRLIPIYGGTDTTGCLNANSNKPVSAFLSYRRSITTENNRQQNYQITLSLSVHINSVAHGRCDSIKALPEPITTYH